MLSLLPRPAYRFCLTGMVMLLSFGCVEGSGDERTTPASESSTRSSANGDAGEERGANEEANEERLQVCDDREQAISDWLTDYRHCEVDSDCEMAGTYGGCVAEFLCGFAMNVDVDHRVFGREASRKVSEFVEACWCAAADCSDVTEAYCEPTTRLCEAR